MHGPIVWLPDNFGYFSGGYGVNDYELWKTDGTQTGTVLVKDINPGISGSRPEHLTEVNGTLFFTADDGVNGTELWKSNGTAAGTVLVKDIAGSPFSSSPSLLTNVNGTLFFTAFDFTNGTELWKSNGTTAGTVLVKDIVPGFFGPGISEMVNESGTLFFNAAQTFADYQLWKSDGTSGGTVKVTSVTGAIFGLNPQHLTPTGSGTLFFSGETTAAGAELWKSDGTSGGTAQVADIRPGTFGSSPDQIRSLASGIVVFTASDGTTGRELWRGTTSGASQLMDINPGLASSNPDQLTYSLGKIYFVANDGVHGVEPWVTNGSGISGTTTLADLLPGPASSNPTGLAAFSTGIAFGANYAFGLGQLWTFDTSFGPRLIYPYVAAVDKGMQTFADIGGGKLVFSANDGSNGAELWRSDGSPQLPTFKIARDGTSTDGSGMTEFTQIGNTMYFTGLDTTRGREFGKTDGTAQGTTLLEAASGPVGGVPTYLTNLNGSLLFSAYDPSGATKLWNSDGTGQGTLRVFPASGTDFSDPKYLTNVSGTVFFSASNSGFVGLWKTNATTAGTQNVLNSSSGGLSLSPKLLTNVNGRLFFTGTYFNSPFTLGTELWTSDGTTAGTQMLKKTSSNQVANPKELTAVNSTLFYVANDGSNGNELWKSDGTLNGTTMVKAVGSSSVSPAPANLVNVNGTLFFTANDGANGVELWKSDGTATGTIRVKDIRTGSEGSDPRELTNVNGTLFFTADDGVSGRELWKSDGTAGGTIIVTEIGVGAASGQPSNLTTVRGSLFFAAGTTAHGRELWKSDGTVNGTAQLFEIAPGALSSSPRNMTAFGRQLLFTADDSTHGREAWITPPETNAAPSGADKTLSILENNSYTFAESDFGFSDAGNLLSDSLLEVQVTGLTITGTLKDDGAAVSAGQSIPAADIRAGKLVYTPTAKGNGNALLTMTFKVQDDGGTAGGGADLALSPSTLTINVTSVNDQPSGADGAITVYDHVPYTFSFAEFGFGDANDTPPNTLQSVKLTTLPSAGTIAINGVSALVGTFVSVTATLVFTPAATVFSTQSPYASFTFQVRDNGGTLGGGVDLDQSPNTLTINLTGVHNAPVGADKTVTTTEDAPFAFSASDFGFSDPGDNPADNFMGVRVSTLPVAGTLKLGDVAISAGDVVPFASIGALTFAPPANANGKPYVNFTFQVQDDGGTANNGSDVDATARTISLNVTEINDPPSVLDDLLSSVAEDSGPRTIAFATLLANDSKGPANESSQTLTITAVSGAVGGSVSIVGTNVVFSPLGDYNGPAGFTYTVRDDGTTNGAADFKTSTGAVSFSIPEVNDPPSAVNDPLSSLVEGSEAQTISIATLLANDSPGPANESSQLLALTDVGGAVGGNVSIVGTNVIFTPSADFNGLASFIYTVRDDGTTSGAADPKTSTSTVSFTITEINDSPSGTDDALSSVAEDSAARTIAFAALLANDSKGPANESDQTLSITNISGAVGGNVSIVGANVIFSPAADYNGPAGFTYALRDNGTTNGTADFKTSTATVSFMVTEVNDAPSVANDPLASMAEDSGSRTIPFAALLANDSTGPADESAQTLTIIGVSGAAGGSVSISGANVIFTPTDNYNGPASFTYTVQDNGTTNGTANAKTSSAVVSFAITEVNDAPAGVDNVLASIAEDSGPRTIAFAALLANDSKGPANESGQTLIITNVSGAVGGTVSIVGSNVVFAPSADYNGPASFTYALRDDGTTNSAADFKTSTATASFTIDAVNDAPTFAKGPDQTISDEDPPRIVPGWATNLAKGPPAAIDESGQTLSFVVTTDNTDLFSVQPQFIQSTALFFAPKPNRAGTAHVSVVLKDNGGTANGGVDQSSPQTFTISVIKTHVEHNTLNALDVTGPGGMPDGHVVAGDALEIINFINAFGSQPVPTDGRATGPYYDVNADGSVAPSDALDIIDHINAFGAGEGEGGEGSGFGVQGSEQRGQGVSGKVFSLDELTGLLAIDVASQPRRRP